MRPRSVNLIKQDGRTVEETVSGVMGFFYAYMFVILLSAVLVSIDSFVRDVSFESCLTAVVATVSNIGPGLGEVGPMGSFAHFTNFSKAVLTLDMLVGRLELFPLLMLFLPTRGRNKDWPDRKPPPISAKEKSEAVFLKIGKIRSSRRDCNAPADSQCGPWN